MDEAERVELLQAVVAAALVEPGARRISLVCRGGAATTSATALAIFR